MRDSLIAVFESTTETLKAERALKEAGLKPRPVIKPRKLGGSCQMALKLSTGPIALIKSTLSEQKLRLVGFFIQDSAGEWVSFSHE